MRRHNNLATPEEIELPGPSVLKVPEFDRNLEIASAMARLKAKIDAEMVRKQNRSWRDNIRSSSRTTIPVRENVTQLAVRTFKLYEFKSVGASRSVGAARKSAPPTASQDYTKLEWALKHPSIFPLDINSAAPELLLKVPGFGATLTRRIFEARKYRRLGLADLQHLKVPLHKAKYFIKTDDVNPYLHSFGSLDAFKNAEKTTGQLDLFT